MEFDALKTAMLDGTRERGHDGKICGLRKEFEEAAENCEREYLTRLEDEEGEDTASAFLRRSNALDSMSKVIEWLRTWINQQLDDNNKRSFRLNEMMPEYATRWLKAQNELTETETETEKA